MKTDTLIDMLATQAGGKSVATARLEVETRGIA